MICGSIPWENKDIGTDDYIEQFYGEGREDQLLDPTHFQGLFLLMGILVSTGLGKSSSRKHYIFVIIQGV